MSVSDGTRLISLFIIALLSQIEIIVEKRKCSGIRNEEYLYLSISQALAVRPKFLLAVSGTLRPDRSDRTEPWVLSL